MKAIALLFAGIVSQATILSAADVTPIIEMPWRYVVGGHSDGKWLSSGQAGKTIKEGSQFRLFTLQGEKGKITASKASPDEDVCLDIWMVEANSDDDTEAFGIASSWNPMPRAVKQSDHKQEAYLKAVSEILTREGIRKPEVKITQHLRVDLDGDGSEEVLLAATKYPTAEGEGNAPTSATSGSYSFVMLRRLVAGKVVTQILQGEFYPKAQEFNAPNVHKVGAVLDLDGDGKMEIMLNSQYYEGGGTTVWKLGQQQASKVMEIACGV